MFGKLKKKTYLDEIILYKEKELEERKKSIPYGAMKMQLQFSKPLKDFKGALTADGIRIIAEVKKASPSKGIIREDFDHLEIAEVYEKSGAAAISVLTDSHFFKGSIEYLTQIRQAVQIPLLRKDFIIDEYQVVEARVYGADAILLIATVLTGERLKYLYDLSLSFGMEVLVEVHNEEDLEKAIKIGASIIGINNRDLKKFTTDINTTCRLAKLMPEGTVVVSESGINSREDIEFLSKGGAHAFLIGEAFMREPDPGLKLKEFIG